METRLLKEQLRKIEMPEEMQDRIVCCCSSAIERKKTKMEERNMADHKTYTSFKRRFALVACLALCLCFTGVTALAATGKLQGFFKDIKRLDGAVIGTTYEQATEEILVDIKEDSDSYILEIKFLTPDKAPYFTFETFGVKHYKIQDTEGNSIIEGAIDMEELSSDHIVFPLSAEILEQGSYTFIIDQFLGGSKADQPLTIKGLWECEFSK